MKNQNEFYKGMVIMFFGLIKMIMVCVALTFLLPLSVFLIIKALFKKYILNEDINESY